MTLEFYSWFPVINFFFLAIKLTQCHKLHATRSTLPYHAGIDMDIIRLIYEIQATMADRL